MKVCVVTTEYSLATNIALAKLLSDPGLTKHQIEIVSVVSTNHVSALSPQAWKKLSRFIHKSGLEFTLKYISINTWQKLNLKLNRLFLSPKKRKLFEISELCEQQQIPYLNVDSVNTNRFHEHLKDHNVDLIVSCLLLEKVTAQTLKTTPLGGINFHPGIFSEHRGTFSGFWALLNNRKKAGATVHFMTENFDDGQVITQRKFRLMPQDSMNCVNEKSAAVGGKLLVKALIKIKKRQVKAQSIKRLSPLFSMPSMAQVNRFQKAYFLIRAKDWWRV